MKDHLPPEIPAALLHLLQDTLGSQVVIETAQTVNQHQDYLVLVLQLSRPAVKIVVKLAGPKAWMASSFEQTAAIHRLVSAHTSLPVAEVLAADESMRRWPWRYLISAYIEGLPFSEIGPRLSGDARRSAFEQIGQAAGQLHSIGFEGHGEIGTRGEVIEPTGPLAGLKTRARRMLLGSDLQDFFISALDRYSGWFESGNPAELCHEDLHKYNILFKIEAGQVKLAALLDFQKAWAGSAESDLARLELWNMTGDGFWQGYRSCRNLSPGYPLRRLVYQLFWCLEYAEMTPAHLADTRRVCEALGLPVIRQFDPLVIT